MTADERKMTGSGPRKQLCLVLGGVRSGKSAFALSLAERKGERVLFLATAEALDEEMRDRIERHRRDRPDHWRTVEAPAGAGETLRAEAGDADVVLLDCLGFLVANLMGEHTEDAAALEARVETEIDSLLAAYDAGTATLIVVSNEVGMGVVPPYPSGRVFRDALGRANQRLARAADRVYWMVAGMPVEVKASGLAEKWEESP
ncbi:MAG TPA: bifunctional adenosylcobinamide kinase/adenosylcobinamide-phosphate guanylyltransferase [Armatimonadota bacterium]|nr:bifunctional adenosylcobinamide kinase/adenosylcobinamide-phosphate guanylyltransferase [Armatimonadota bacterium]